MTRLQYLLFSTILATGILAIVHLADLQQELDRELLEHIQEMQELLDEAEQENTELQEQAKIYQVNANVRESQRQILSRSGRPSLAILSPSGFTAGDFEAAFANLNKPGMAGLGQALVDAEAETGVNALILAGIASLESSWGTSLLAREKCNLGGLGALDGVPGSAMTFKNRQDCILFLAELVKDGGTVEEVGRWYASDPAWARKVQGCMRMIAGVTDE